MKWLWSILSAIAEWLSKWLGNKSGEADSEDVSDQIDKADDAIIDDPDPKEGDDDDFFDHDGWNN